MSALCERWVERDCGHETPCWLWKLYIDGDGYGKMTIYSDGRKSTTTAQRFVYELFIGEVPDGWTLDHLCPNRSCVNPGHLEPVPHRVNVLRSRVTKLTREIVEDVRSRRGVQSGPMTATELGIGTSTVYDIWNERTWAT